MPIGVRSKSWPQLVHEKGMEPRLGVLRGCVQGSSCYPCGWHGLSPLFYFLPSLLFSKTGVNFSLFFRLPIQTGSLVMTREKLRTLFPEGGSFRAEWFETTRLWTSSVGDWVAQTRPSGQSLSPAHPISCRIALSQLPPCPLSAPPFCPYLFLLFSY